MYAFADTIGTNDNITLPSEALNLNGQYLEELIGGYRTLYVKGRESLNAEVSTLEPVRKHGSIYQRRRYPERVITVGFQLLSSSPEEFREKWNTLGGILNCEEARLIFADETDKYFTGTPTEIETPEAGVLNVRSEIQFICTDPFKYSLEEYEASPTEDDGATCIIDYKGTQQAFPAILTSFYQSEETDNTEGECGFVAFVNDRGNILQFGDPSEEDTTIETVQNIITNKKTWTTTELLVNEPFNASGAWGLNQGFITMQPTYKQVGSVKFGRITANGEDPGVLQVNSYGSGASAHGPSVTRTIPNDSAGVAGAKNWTFSWSQRLCTAKSSKTAAQQAGHFQVFILDGNGGYIAGAQIWKAAGSSKGKVRVYVRDKSYVKTWDNVDLSYYNSRWGYKVKSTDKRILQSSIKKAGSVFTFNIGGLVFSYTYPAAADIQARKICFWFGQVGTKPVPSITGVYWCKFQSDSVVKSSETHTVETLSSVIDIKNTFGTNDVLVADCNDASIRMIGGAYDEDGLDGELRPDLGAAGNQWEQFALEPGINQINMTYSDWVPDEYRPSFKVRYREVFL